MADRADLIEVEGIASSVALDIMENEKKDDGFMGDGKKDEKEPKGSFNDFLDSFFGGLDNSANESPDEKMNNNDTDTFFSFPILKTGPVQQPHNSLNDLFSNIAKPGPHPKFIIDDET